MTSPLRIRIATPDDASSIAGFNSALARETEGIDLDPTTIRQGVLRLLTTKDRGVYFVAEHEGRIVGQMMVTYEWSDWRNGWFWWIQSVYVDPGHRQQGVFNALYDHVHMQAMHAPDVCGLRLYVERNNERAKRTYEKMGMAKTHYEMYEVLLPRKPLSSKEKT